MRTGSVQEMFKNVIAEDIPNLGSIITLDNKGRLINSQFSKPSSSQTLLKLNSTDEVPDADDLPYGIISYGDTPNLINLPYNDHNYASVHYSKKLENYDRKALDYVLKQSSQTSNRTNFPTSGSVRISHYSSFNTSSAHNDSVFFGDKYKQHQFAFNQQISHCSTPLVSNKSISSISQNNMYTKNKIMPSAIVINSGTVNKLKSMNVIQLRRPTIDSTSMGETRIINLPLKKPSVLTNIMGNNQINGNRESIMDKTDLSKSINLIPRCVCGFTHDDGGMIRCEICRTWQHIVCMYPDNKFPIYYKCERCEPRDVDIKRAVSTQTNVLLKTAYAPSDLVLHGDYDPEHDLENNFVKSTNSSHFVFVQPESTNAFNYHSESVPNTSLPIFITSPKDSQALPPGSPRTSKRKQDLISLKTVLGKPSLNVNLVTNKLELQKPMLENSTNYHAITAGYIVPTSSHKLLSEARDASCYVNELSYKLKTILSSRLQYHTNMTVYHLQYLKQNSFTINTNMYDVVLIDCTRYAVKTIVEFNSNEVIMEYNGYVSLADEYNKESDFRKNYNPFVLFYDKYDHLQLCINSQLVDNKAKYVRRSCTPNSEVKHRLLQDGQIRFYVVPINRIYKDSEITIGFDYNFMKCRYKVECACNQPSCQLIYLTADTDTRTHTIIDDMDSQNMNMYECTNVNLGMDTARLPVTVTRPYKKRGRGCKVSNNITRSTTESEIIDTSKSTVKIIRRNKRGRPPLNRSLGLQRANVFVKSLSDNASNHNLSDYKDTSDNESTHSRSNQNNHSRMTIHTNFKNFKRISSCHWSLKANRKMAAVAKKSKPLKKLLISPKVGRPVKYKKSSPIKLEQENRYLSDHSHSDKVIKTSHKENYTYYSNDENDEGNNLNKLDLSREEEGKYWLEEINSKILKQKVKEAKRVQRKNKYNRRKLNQGNPIISPSKQNAEANKMNKQDEVSHEKLKEEKMEISEFSQPDPIEKEEIPANTEHVLKKSKRGRKSLKQNTISYILSYKPSSIDDLKKDLMLISASLEDETEKEVVKNDIINEANEEYRLDTDLKEIPVSLEECKNESTTEVMPLKESELDHDYKPIESTNDLHRIYRSKTKRRGLNKSNGSGKDLSRKASREERWVNIMWQRILKNEHSDDKTKRKCSKSSAAEESIASEDNRNESSDIGSPKMANCEMYDDRDSSSNSKSSSAHKCRQKMNAQTVSECETRPTTESYLSVKLIDCGDMKSLMDKSNTVSMTSSGSVDESQLNDHKDASEQCGLIVYKEQHSNPMEKFSRENSAKLITSDNYVDGVTTASNSINVSHQAHTKKRWLSQALMEETFSEVTHVSKSDTSFDDDITNKLSLIDSVSKRSFLPPLLTTIDNIDLISSNVQKVAMNPKKRLLNQFSMEDSSLRISNDDNYNDNMVGVESHMQFKSSQSEPNADQEQAKIKLSLSEYRKRRFVDKTSNDFSNILLKSQSSSGEFNEAWVGLGQITPNVDGELHYRDGINRKIRETGTDIVVTEARDQNKPSETDNIADNMCESAEINQLLSLTYIDTLNNLAMPTNLDPRLSNSALLNSDTNASDHDLSVIIYQDSSVIKPSCIEQNRSLDTLVNVDEDNGRINGPRTPSENGDISNTITRIVQSQPLTRQSEGSVHSFESQPSPTSDSHFDLEKDIKSIMELEKCATVSVTSPWPTDWMTNTATIGKLAGIKNPDLLQEIEEFEDEYIPMPEILPERTKEEIETLLLTQKRDFQIREWQEVKQLEREKVKLDHQVRSMERRLHRVNRPSALKLSGSLKSHNSMEDSSKGVLATYDVKNDEKTMKAFNVQLANINGRLMEQINSLRSDGSSRAVHLGTAALSTATVGQSRHVIKRQRLTTDADCCDYDTAAAVATVVVVPCLDDQSTGTSTTVSVSNAHIVTISPGSHPPLPPPQPPPPPQLLSQPPPPVVAVVTTDTAATTASVSVSSSSEHTQTSV